MGADETNTHILLFNWYRSMEGKQIQSALPAIQSSNDLNNISNTDLSGPNGQCYYLTRQPSPSSNNSFRNVFLTLKWDTLIKNFYFLVIILRPLKKSLLDFSYLWQSLWYMKTLVICLQEYSIPLANVLSYSSIPFRRQHWFQSIFYQKSAMCNILITLDAINVGHDM